MTDSLTQVGRIGKAKGLKGDVKVFFEAFFFELLAETTPDVLFLKADEKAAALPYFVEELRDENGTIILKFEEVDSRTAVEKIRGHDVFIRKTELEAYVSEADMLEDWEYLIGFQLLNAEKEMIGTINDIFERDEQDLMQLFIQGVEVLIPLVDELVIAFKESEKQLQMHIPDGLLELYLNPTNDEDREHD